MSRTPGLPQKLGPLGSSKLWDSNRVVARGWFPLDSPRALENIRCEEGESYVRTRVRQGYTARPYMDMDTERVRFPREWLREAARRRLLGVRHPVRWGGGDRGARRGRDRLQVANRPPASRTESQSGLLNAACTTQAAPLCVEDTLRTRTNQHVVLMSPSGSMVARLDGEPTHVNRRNDGASVDH